LLGDDRRVLQDDVRHLGAEPDPLRSPGSGREDGPHVLVVSLVGAVAGPEAELVEELDHVQKLVDRLLRQKLVAEPHTH
jgi:hypothetical protein